MMDSRFDPVRLNLGGAAIGCAFRFPDTRRYFRRSLLAEPADPASAIRVTEQAYRDWEKAGNQIDAFAEFCLLCQPCSEALMDAGRCVFHAFALRCNDRAFLIAGGSGVGKSTHGKLLLDRYPEEFSAINGDKPVLQVLDDQVMVHPSPWNGKEGLRGAPAAPLAAIFFLRRTEENYIKPLKEKETALCAFPMVFQSFENEAVIRKSGTMTEQIVRRVPGYLFSSCEIEPSSELLYQAIREVAEHDI